MRLGLIKMPELPLGEGKMAEDRDADIAHVAPGCRSMLRASMKTPCTFGIIAGGGKISKDIVDRRDSPVCETQAARLAPALSDCEELLPDLQAFRILGPIVMRRRKAFHHQIDTGIISRDADQLIRAPVGRERYICGIATSGVERIAQSALQIELVAVSIASLGQLANDGKPLFNI